MKQAYRIWWQYLLPQLTLSRFIGRLAKTTRLPRLRLWILQWYVAHYQVDLSLAERQDLKSYTSFNDFFTRALKSDARIFVTIPNAVLMPADGTISECGPIEAQRVLQAKQHHYGLSDLLAGDEDLANLFQNGSFLTVYLSPRDYHRVHMPLAGQLTKMIYVPGRLFSVNPLTVAAVPNLFARNERVICIFETAVGPMAIVLVGALIVGSIVTNWAGEIRGGQTILTWNYAQDEVVLAQGESLGHFQLGSTVIALFPKKGIEMLENLSAKTVVKVGELLGWQKPC